MQESKTIEMFSGIPVKQLKANDASRTELDLSLSVGCGVAEALVLGALLKVRVCSFGAVCAARICFGLCGCVKRVLVLQ